MTEETHSGKSLLGRWFPTRYLYLRDGDDVRAWALTPGRQALGALAAVLIGSWFLVASGGFGYDLIMQSQADRTVARARAASERLNADLQARLESAVVRMTATTGSLDEMAEMVERRHAALTQVMGMFRGVDGAQAALTPAPSLDPANNSPVQRMLAVRMDQERLIARAETVAQTRAERLRLAFRLAGLNPSAYAPAGTAGLGGPLVEAQDPRALAAVLDVDEAFAVRIRNAADNLSDMRGLADAAEGMPFHRPTNARTTSGFGVRFDPFNRHPALHQGQDFAAPLNTPIAAPAPGIVSFVGVRSGYGNTVEIDHGRGFKTRYAHLNSMAVRPGQRVALGQRIGAMGTTGRSTGVHLHYEVWMNGRPQNPARFMRAGDQLVQQD
ncbi:murein DD-endopeptidase MepM/ murein hydrolase activator NlpD [Brevundimonas alba]|uniref:Murein DD-endopeptidase MepM/ murein hydrolase activator NlpD n=1 Tax=Brevundimonas alba TaxID=74314 RepID=A0A7X6BP91_9CAUL|nr:M23 family metallopeptidase [Brevundimonas alba]NJC42202.1 murein DD-endopeptidase MepM/ murein hydrolase activator NlpD [Brevundimonas alba]